MERDDIDELVDWQMAQEPKPMFPGAPRRLNADRCMCCGREWHGLPNSECSGSFI